MWRGACVNGIGAKYEALATFDVGVIGHGPIDGVACNRYFGGIFYIKVFISTPHYINRYT